MGGSISSLMFNIFASGLLKRKTVTLGENLANHLISSNNYRLKEALEFLLKKRGLWHGEVFEEVSESAIQPGDIVLFHNHCKHGIMGNISAHAAVYCGNGEVIHLQYSKRNGSKVSKEGLTNLKKKKGRCEIYRKKGGIDLDDFNRNVMVAMNCKAKYCLGTNNCVHFALYLLDMVEFDMDPAELHGAESC